MNNHRSKTQWLVAFLAIVIAFGALSPMPSAGAVPTLTHRDSIDFKTVTDALPRSMGFSNRGDESTTIESAAIIGDGFVILSEDCSGLTLNTDDDCRVEIGPQPTVSGLQTAILRVVHTGGTIDVPVSATYEVLKHVFVGSHRSENSDPTTAWLGSGVVSAVATSSTLNIKTVDIELDIELPTGEIFTTGAQWSDLGEQSAGLQGSLDVGCRGIGAIEVDDARYAPDGSVEVLTLSITVRCDPENLMRNIVVHVANIDDAGVVIGPRTVDIAGVLEGDRGGSAFVYNSTNSPINLDVSAPEVAGADVDERCPASLGSHAGCSVVVSAPLGSTPGPVNGTIAVTAGAVSVTVPYEAVHETAAYLHRNAWASSLQLTSWDETTPGRQMVVRSSDPRTISFTSIEDGAGWYVGIISLLAGGDLAPGRYELVPDTPGPGQISVSGNIVCLDRSGIVDVHDYESDGGRIDRISLSIVVYCGDDALPASYFDFRYNVELDNPWIAVSTREVRFDPVERFEPTSSTVTVTNHGRGPGTLEALIVGSSNFSLGDGCVGTVLLPGESCSLEIVASTDEHLRSLSEARIFLGITGGALGFTDIAVNIFFDTPDMTRSGYWVLQADGTVTPFGDAARLFGGELHRQFVHIEPTWDGRGYWLLDSTGLVFSFGKADRLGLDPGERVTTMASTPDSRGYWVFTNLGRVIPFGNAPDIGDLLGFDLTGEIVASTSSPSGRGAYMIGSDGGVFALGDAVFAGSIPQVLPGVALNQPVVGLVADPDGSGYWMVAADGGVFAFDAPYRGSVPEVLPPGAQVAEPVNGMVPFFDGYLLVAADGGVFNFSSEPFQGSLAEADLDSPVVAIAPLL